LKHRGKEIIISVQFSLANGEEKMKQNTTNHKNITKANGNILFIYLCIIMQLKASHNNKY